MPKYKTKQLGDGKWYVLGYLGIQAGGPDHGKAIWMKMSETGHNTQTEAQTALDHLNAADADAKRQLLNASDTTLSQPDTE